MSDLVVLSHLRWVFVWQRPQHLIARLARGRRTWFVEEPEVADVLEPTLHTEEHGAVTRVWLDIPGGEARHVNFGDPDASSYPFALRRLLGTQAGRVVWLYTPMAFDLATALDPDVLVYDVMDDLASFKGAPAGLRFLQQQTLRKADVVFAGGRSLHASVAGRRPDAHLFPSGVEPEHFAVARPTRHERPVAGYVGVIDERIDLELVAGLAAALLDWEIRLVGPVAKIDERTLPRAENITYPGSQPYAELPNVMAEFDVALMPFALNEATASISPTKTLEYFAAGLPVVSTRVPDVVADYGTVVALADDARAFAAACRVAAGEDAKTRRHRFAPILRLHHWDAIAARMEALVAAATEPASAEDEGAA